MRLIFVLVTIWFGVAYASTTPDYGIYGETVDGEDLIELGRKLRKPILTLIGLALRNQQNDKSPCGKWTPWSPCDATRPGYFGSQTRSRSCLNPGEMDKKTMTTESDNKLCEGGEGEKRVSGCPASYNRTSNGFCIKLNTTKVSHGDAMEQCKQEGGYLIHIDSQTKHDDVKSLLSGYATNVYIDGRRKDLTSPWEYQYGSESAFLKWDNDYPKNDADFLCLVYQLTTHTQYSYRCSIWRPFVCEIPNV